jgi:hypothetical protein
MTSGEDSVSEREYRALAERLDDALEALAAGERLWFRATREREGLEDALEHYRTVKRLQAEEEARHLMAKYDIAPDGGLKSLAQALRLWRNTWSAAASLYWVDDQTLRYEMQRCRTEEARERLDAPDLPWPSTGIVEQVQFARVIDARIRARILPCPSDFREAGSFCTWEFTMGSAPVPEEDAERDVTLSIWSA